jgi:hypothetical protein
MSSEVDKALSFILKKVRVVSFDPSKFAWKPPPFNRGVGVKADDSEVELDMAIESALSRLLKSKVKMPMACLQEAAFIEALRNDDQITQCVSIRLSDTRWMAEEYNRIRGSQDWSESDHLFYGASNRELAIENLAAELKRRGIIRA